MSVYERTVYLYISICVADTHMWMCWYSTHMCVLELVYLKLIALSFNHKSVLSTGNNLDHCNNISYILLMVRPGHIIIL